MIVEAIETCITNFNIFSFFWSLFLNPVIVFTFIIKHLILKVTSTIYTKSFHILLLIIQLLYLILKISFFFLESHIDARFIVDGHREKTLSLLWKIIFHFQVSSFDGLPHLMLHF